MERLPLFPLSAVLLPDGRMPLQIFEPRYLQLIQRCIDDDTRFGVVFIRDGNDVVQNPDDPMPRLVPVGCSARIVNWELLPDGRYTVLIEGERKFRLLGTEQDENFLVIGDIEWLPAEQPRPLPEQSAALTALLDRLMQHPHIARMGFKDKLDDAVVLSNLLAQILPMDEAQRFQLLAETDALRRLDLILGMLEQFDE